MIFLEFYIKQKLFKIKGEGGIQAKRRREIFLRI